MIRSIVVGTDGSATADEAVDRAARLAQALGARVHVVSAYEPAAGVKLAGVGGDPEQREWATRPDVEVEAVLVRATGALNALGVEAKTYARRTGAAEAILDVAEEQAADLIIVGNKGMRGTRRFLLGSVPNKVSHHAPCSVLIVRTT